MAGMERKRLDLDKGEQIMYSGTPFERRPKAGKSREFPLAVDQELSAASKLGEPVLQKQTIDGVIYYMIAVGGKAFSQVAYDAETGAPNPMRSYRFVDEYVAGQVVELRCQRRDSAEPNKVAVTYYPYTGAALSSNEGWDTVTLTAPEAESLNTRGQFTRVEWV